MTLTQTDDAGFLSKNPTTTPALKTNILMHILSPITNGFRITSTFKSKQWHYFL